MRDERLGNYRLLSCIGEGGMGTVYRAEHTLLGRAVAIKVLQPALSQDPEMVERLFHEARATAQLRHPGIVDVFDFGTCADGAAYLVMELLDGESLTSRLARGRLAWPQACRFARQIASALAAAHRAQIVHRDLKPDNVFLVREPDQKEERTTVLDFGIAKLADAGARGTARTRAGAIMGTPAYMSPQQCRGAGQVDHRADIYALGCILFEMVCGRPPFVGEGLGDLIHAHMTQLPPAPRGLAPELPEALEQLIFRMLAKPEADRPPSMDAVAAELDGIAAAATGAPGNPATLPPQAPGAIGTASRAAAITTFGGSAGQVTGASPGPSPRRRLVYFFGLAASLGMAATVAAALVLRTHLPRPPAEHAAAAHAPTSTPAAEPPPPPLAAPAAPHRRKITVNPLPLPAGELAGEPPPPAVAAPPRAGELPPRRAGLPPHPGEPSPRPGEPPRRPAADTAPAPASRAPAMPPAATHADALAALLSAGQSLGWFDAAATDRLLASALGRQVSLTVTSSPSGADVAFDGEILGKTPLSLSVERGMYELTLVLTHAHRAERALTLSAVLDRTEQVVLPALVTRQVISKPPGAELSSHGEVIGKTPCAIELPESDPPEPLTLHLAGYLDQTVAIAPDRPGTTSAVLEREPQPVVHELGCDPACEVVLDGDVVGKATPGSSYRAEFLEQKGRVRSYLLRPTDNQHRSTSYRAPADRSVKALLRLPCAPRQRAGASARPHVYDPYDSCNER